MKPIFIKRRSKPDFNEVEKGGNGKAYIIGDAKFMKKCNNNANSIILDDSIHAIFKINHDDTAIQISITSDQVEITIYRYEIIKVIKDGKVQFELWKNVEFKQLIQRLNLALNDFKYKSYYRMLEAAYTKCYDKNPVCSYYSANE